MTDTESPQEFADRHYITGCRDGLSEAICHLIDLVNDAAMDYVFSEIEKELKRKRKMKYDREWG